jgi:hypothetical protein
MANLSGQNPALNTPDLATRRHDPVDDLLRLGSFAAITTSTNGTGIPFKAQKVGPYMGVVTYNGHAATSENYWTIQITGADNASYTNEVVLASIKLSSGSAAAKEYLALEGAAVESLMAAAGEDEAIYVRAKAVEEGTAAALTAQVYLTCD